MKQSRRQKFIATIGILLLLSSAILPAIGQKKDRNLKRVEEAVSESKKAAEILDKISKSADKAIPKELLGIAKAVAVFPTKQEGFLIEGVIKGKGLVSRRMGGSWSNPVYFEIGSVSLGPQIGD